MKVQDDGPGLAPALTGQSHGIGLANTRARLHRLYGDAAWLSVENDGPRGVTATVVVPYRVADSAEWREKDALHDLAG